VLITGPVRVSHSSLFVDGRLVASEGNKKEGYEIKWDLHFI